MTEIETLGGMIKLENQPDSVNDAGMYMYVELSVDL